jgi:endonuclease/exonuclease/phosphatase family metal-dependent hydrolase
MKWFKALIYIIISLLVMALALLGIATLKDYRPGPEEEATTDGKARETRPSDSIFTLISWNLGYFGLGEKSDFFYDGGKMSRPDQDTYLEYSGNALEYLASSMKADFYLFQEVDFRSRRSYKDDQLAGLKSALPGMFTTWTVNYRAGFVPMPLNDPMGAVNSGLVSFLAFETKENIRYAFPGGYSWPLGIFMLDRCFLLSRLPLPGGKELVLINTHNEAFDDGSQRRQQLAVLKDLMIREYSKGNFVVTGGDWNQNPVGYATGSFITGDVSRTIEPEIEPEFFPEGWQWAFDPSVPTNRDVNQLYQRGKTPSTIIDFFVVSPNVSVLETRTSDLAFRWSDHQPVMIRFRCI